MGGGIVRMPFKFLYLWPVEGIELGTNWFGSSSVPTEPPKIFPRTFTQNERLLTGNDNPSG